VKITGDSEYFKKVSRRFQAILQFYIDGASFIDDDPNWHYFVCFMDNKIVGFTSVFEQFDELDKKSASNASVSSKQKKQTKSSRVLLSQFIVLPPFQGLGIGSTILKIVYDYYLNENKLCREFSVEEPSD
jgi:histone acetyltransferase 1